MRVRLSLDTGSARASGREVVTARTTHAVAFVRLTPGAAYCEGNAVGLAATCGLSIVESEAAAGRWVALARTSAQYRLLARALLLRGQVASILPKVPTGLIVSGRALLAGTPTVVLEGPAPAASSFGANSVLRLYIALAGAPLLVRAVVSSPLGTAVTETFTRWGETVAAPVPGRSVGLAVLG